MEGVCMGLFDLFKRKGTPAVSEPTSSSATHRDAAAVAVTQRLLNDSMRAIEQRNGSTLQRSDAELLLRIHTDLMSHQQVFTHFAGARQGMLLSHLAHVLLKSRDIVTSSP